MASLPTANPNLAVHLTDRALTPLITSNSPQSAPSQSQALSTLTTSAISAYDTASRLQLGLPQRIMISTTSNGPLILHSFLNPTSTSSPPSNNYSRGILESTREELRPLTATTTNSDFEAREGEPSLANGINGIEVGKDEEEEGGANAAPLLIATVVAPRSEEAGDARRAAARLERIGVEFQRVWVREEEEATDAGSGENEDG